MGVAVNHLIIKYVKWQHNIQQIASAIIFINVLKMRKTFFNKSVMFFDYDTILPVCSDIGQSAYLSFLVSLIE